MASAGFTFAKEATRRPSTVLALELIICLASLWMRFGFPIYAFPDSMLDDGLFIRSAQHLVNGEWLGPYDNATLAKGMMYPLLIACSAWLGLPLKCAEQIIYLAVSWGTGRAVSTFTGKRAWGTATLCLLAANPVLWNEQLARVIRDAFYLSETLAVIVLTALVCRRGRPRIGAACLLGVTYGAVWLTREEGVWLLPVILAMVLMAIALAATDTSIARSPVARLRVIAPLSICVAVAVAFFGLVDVSVSTINLFKYGVFTSSEFHQQAFVRGYGSLARVKPAQWRRYVVFPHQVWASVFAVSPAARELQPALEGQVGKDWQQTAAALSGNPRETEILSGWFVWVLRDAVAKAGHYTSASEASSFYNRLSSQIDAACTAGRLQCLPPRATMAPPWHWEYIADTARTVPALTSLVFTMGRGSVGAPPSHGEPSRLEQLSDMAGPVTEPFVSSKIIRGWLGSKLPPASGEPELEVHSPQNSDFIPTSIIETADPALKTIPGLHGFRFVIDSACDASCSVDLSVGGIVKATLPWPVLANGPGLNAPAVWLNIDNVGSEAIEIGTSRRRHLQAQIGHAIGLAYAVCVPIASAIAFVGFAVGLTKASTRQTASSVIVLATGAIVAIAVRILLLSYLDATSLPARTPLYTACVTPAVLVFITTGLYLLICGLRKQKPKAGLF